MFLYYYIVVNRVYRAIVNNINLGIKFIGNVVFWFRDFWYNFYFVRVNIFVNSNKLIYIVY